MYRHTILVEINGRIKKSIQEEVVAHLLLATRRTRIHKQPRKEDYMLVAMVFIFLFLVFGLISRVIQLVYARRDLLDSSSLCEFVSVRLYVDCLTILRTVAKEGRRLAVYVGKYFTTNHCSHERMTSRTLCLSLIMTFKKWSALEN